MAGKENRGEWQFANPNKEMRFDSSSPDFESQFPVLNAPKEQKGSSNMEMISGAGSSRTSTLVLGERKSNVNADNSHKKPAKIRGKKHADVPVKKPAPVSGMKHADVSVKKPAPVSGMKNAEVSAKKRAPVSGKNHAEISVKKSVPVSVKKHAEITVKKPAKVIAKKSAKVPGSSSSKKVDSVQTGESGRVVKSKKKKNEIDYSMEGTMKRVDLSVRLQEKIDDEVQRRSPELVSSPPKKSIIKGSLSKMKKIGTSIGSKMSNAFKSKGKTSVLLSSVECHPCDREDLAVANDSDIFHDDNKKKRRRHESSNSSRRVRNKKERTKTPAPSRKLNQGSTNSLSSYSTGSKRSRVTSSVSNRVNSSGHSRMNSSTTPAPSRKKKRSTTPEQEVASEIANIDVLERHRTQRADYFESRREVESMLPSTSQKNNELVKFDVDCYELRAQKWRKFVAPKFSDLMYYSVNCPTIVRYSCDTHKMMKIIVKEVDGFRCYALKRVYYDQSDDIYYADFRCKQEKLWDVTRITRDFSPEESYTPVQSWSENTHYIYKDERKISEFVREELPPCSKTPICDKNIKFAVQCDSILYKNPKNGNLILHQDAPKELGCLLYPLPRKRSTKPHCCKPLDQDNNMRDAIISSISVYAKNHFTVDIYHEVETVCDIFQYDPPNGIRALASEIRHLIEYRRKRNWGQKSLICPSVDVNHMNISFRSSILKEMKQVQIFDEEVQKEYLMGAFRHHIEIYWNEEYQVVSADGTFKSAKPYSQYYLISLDFWISDEKCASVLAWHGYSNNFDEIFYERLFDKMFTDVKECGKKIGVVKCKIDMELGAKKGFLLAAAKHGVDTGVTALFCNFHNLVGLRRYVSGNNGRARLSPAHETTIQHLMACKFVHPSIVFELIKKICDNAKFTWQNKLASSGKKVRDTDGSVYFPDTKSESIEKHVDDVYTYWSDKFTHHMESFSWYNEIMTDRRFAVGFDLTTNVNESRHCSINLMHKRYNVKHAKKVDAHIETNNRWLKEHFSDTSCGNFTYRNVTNEELNSVNTIYSLCDWSRKIAMRDNKTITPADFDKFAFILRNLTVVKKVGDKVSDYVLPPASVAHLYKPDAVVTPIPAEDFECFDAENSVDTSQFADVLDDDILDSDDGSGIDLGPGFNEKLTSSLDNDIEEEVITDNFDPNVPSSSSRINDLLEKSRSVSSASHVKKKSSPINSRLVSQVSSKTSAAANNVTSAKDSSLSRQMSDVSITETDPYASLGYSPIIIPGSRKSDDETASSANQSPVATSLVIDDSHDRQISHSRPDDLTAMESSVSDDSGSEGSLRDFLIHDEKSGCDDSYHGGGSEDFDDSDFLDEEDEDCEDPHQLRPCDDVERENGSHEEDESSSDYDEMNAEVAEPDGCQEDLASNSGESGAGEDHTDLMINASKNSEAEGSVYYRDSEEYDSSSEVDECDDNLGDSAESEAEDYPPRRQLEVQPSDLSDEESYNYARSFATGNSDNVTEMKRVHDDISCSRKSSFNGKASVSVVTLPMLVSMSRSNAMKPTPDVNDIISLQSYEDNMECENQSNSRVLYKEEKIYVGASNVRRFKASDNNGQCTDPSKYIVVDSGMIHICPGIKWSADETRAVLAREMHDEEKRTVVCSQNWGKYARDLSPRYGTNAGLLPSNYSVSEHGSSGSPRLILITGGRDGDTVKYILRINGRLYIGVKLFLVLY
ncbi:Oidioi.mRNA.OKI2018_I69.PAR.g13228.t1.cds [Oikopleura dioica]|uniref:Oidioi.mRNA.OKI2018_I69.PAR.g13228.t1.cds n=1 Tax=Oikopleura dioica TaxID=34765 RepID=A0ABN7SBS9_OIKDI|nr:Oidioi.mRNA.OKI2018_I69.PAR.g13228.t1.cds [Oikopleura dioica]